MPSATASHDELSESSEYKTSDSDDLSSKTKRQKIGASEGPIPRSQVTRLSQGVSHQKDSAIQSKSSFVELRVEPWLVNSLNAMAIRRPTVIQRECIPQLLDGRDCVGVSKTGSGKTVAFAVPILQKWAQDPFGIFAVVLTPTRELALQIFEQFKAISAAQSLKPVLITGGADMRAQALALSQRPHVVIATPGRLADHIRSSGEDTVYGLRRVRFVVFDEADRLFAEGKGSMLLDIEACIDVMPPREERQTCLFTATVSDALREFPRAPGRPPIFFCDVDTDVLAVPSSLQQRYIKVPVTHRESYLHVFLQTPNNKDKSVIIFCNSRANATLLEHILRLLEYRVTSLHSGLPQSERTSNLARFRARAARILVATDVAARGLDIPTVGLVINYDLPQDPDDYIHRVGRTARAGRKGESVCIVGQRDIERLLTIEERTHSKMEEYSEEGVNLETRVIRDGLKIVGEMKREAILRIDEGRDVKGKRKRGKEKLNRS